MGLDNSSMGSVGILDARLAIEFNVLATGAKTLISRVPIMNGYV